LVLGVDFQITGGKSYGHAPTIDEAKAAFRAEYEAMEILRRMRGGARRLLSSGPISRSN
jgi:hypothetical protein